MPGRKLIVIILAWIAWSAGTVSAFTELTSDAFMEIYRDTIAPRDSNAFQPMTSELVETSFRTLMDHLWNDNLTGAAGVVKELDSLGYRVGLVQVTDTDIYTIGFMELAHPESPYYQGFGACLFRPDSPGLTLYQSVHPTADLYTEYVSMDAFLTDSDAAALMLAGSHKFANPDANHNGFCDSDTAHEGHNLITVLTRDLLNQWMNGIGPAPWIIQFHGAYDRDTEPDIVASYGRDDLLPGAVELQMVNQCLESVHPHTMGICGYPEPFGSSLEDGVYELCAAGNVQGELIIAFGLGGRFMHFELERHIRDDYMNGTGPGCDTIVTLIHCLSVALPEGSTEQLVPVGDGIWLGLLIGLFAVKLRR